MDYEWALAALGTWAERDTNVRAIVMTGSASLGKAHSLSDRDLEIYANDVEALLRDEAWWRRLGDVLVVERLQNDAGLPTRLIYYVGGKLDFTLIPAANLYGTRYERAYNVLLDKDGRGPSLSLRPQRPDLPSASEFLTSVNWAYAAGLMCAKAAVRDELWSAKFRDQDLKQQLLQMIEWDHQARYGADYDTRYLGTRMNEWMDEDVREDLLDCWGHLDAFDTAAALRNTIRLFSTVASRAAAVWNLAAFDHDTVSEEIQAILAQRPSLS